MDRKALPLIVVLFATMLLQNIKAGAQYATAAAYPFYASNQPFNYLSGGTVIPSSSFFPSYDDGYVSNIPIGFPFTFCGTTYTTVTAETNGFMQFGNSTVYYYYPPYSSSYIGYAGPLVMCGWGDQNGNLSSGSGTVTYATTGAAPNRVFTLEFKNWAGTYSSGGSPASISYQYKLYEQGPIELTFKREGSGTPGFPSNATIGIGHTSTDYQTLSNTSASPVSSSTTFNLTGIQNTLPATNQSYMWGVIPCQDTPKYDAKGPQHVCPGRPFTVNAEGASLISGLSFQWQYSHNGTTWSNYTGTGYNTSTIKDSITQKTWYRFTVTCANSGITYTSKPWEVDISAFYYCYCLSNATSTVTSG